MMKMGKEELHATSNHTKERQMFLDERKGQKRGKGRGKRGKEGERGRKHREEKKDIKLLSATQKDKYFSMGGKKVKNKEGKGRRKKEKEEKRE